MNAAAMLALQRIDSALDAVSNRRPRLPEVAAHAAATSALAAVRARESELQRRIQAAQDVIDAAETESETLATKRARLETQLKTIISPREAEALMNEIATLRAHRDELDERELAALEEQADAETELAAVRDELPAAQLTVDEAADALAAATAGLDAEVDELRTARQPAAEALDAGDTAAYERARKQFGGVGIAVLEGHRCSGCHLDLSPAEVDIVKAAPPGEPGECPQCSRYLVR
jgi:predicted  nucleic acid-binding Zn-ribbon protein